MDYKFNGTVWTNAGELKPGTGGGGGGGGGGGATVINVKDFGAKGDGFTNDFSAIQAAINAVPTTGGTVYVPDGTYMITVNNPYSTTTDGSLRLKSNMTFSMSKNAIIKAMTTSQSNYDILRVRGLSNVTIEGGILIGERSTHTGVETGQQGMGVWLSGSSNIRITGVTFKDFWGDGIYVGYRPADANNTNIYVTDSYFFNNRRQGISVCGVDHMTIGNCIFENTQGTDPAAGVDVEPEGGGTVTNLTITGSVFSGNKIGVQALGQASATIMGCTFAGNTTYGIYIGTASYYTIIGNTVTGSGAQGIYLNFATDCVVSDNIIHDSALHGIHLLNGCFRNTISGNRVANNNGYGILLYNAHNNNISNNHCSGNVNSGISTQNSNYTNVTDNYCLTNTQSGIYLYNGKMNTMTGNVACQNGTSGLRVSDCADYSVTENFAMENSQAATLQADNIFISGASSNGRVVGNICRKGTTINLPRYGVRLDSATVTNTLFVNNDIRGGGQTADSSDVGANTIAGSVAIVSVKDFGAVGDGVPDDLPAINAAIAFVNANPLGGEVFFPNGTYRISGRITFNPFKISLRGTGATIDATGVTTGSIIDMVGASTGTNTEHIMKVEGLRLIGSGYLVAGISGSSSNVNAPTRVTVRNMYVTGCSRGLNISDNAWGHNVEDCEFNNNSIGIVMGQTVVGFVEKVSFRGCRFFNSPVALSCDNASGNAEFMFSQCSFMNNTKNMTLAAGTKVFMNECHIEGDSPVSAGAEMFTLTGAGTMLSIMQSRIMGVATGTPAGIYSYFNVDASVGYGGLSIFDCVVSNIPTNRLAVGSGNIDIQRLRTFGNETRLFVPADRMGYLADPSFEGTTLLNQLFTVTTSGTGTVTYDATTANAGGTKSIKFAKPAAADVAEIAFTVPIERGQRAFVDLAYKWDNVVQGPNTWEAFFLRWEYQDNNGIIIGTANEIYRIGTQAAFSVFQFATFQTIVPPRGARKIRFRIGIVGTATGTAWIDDLTINVC